MIFHAYFKEELYGIILSYLPVESILRLKSVLHILLIEFEDCFVSSAILQPI
jgi:hypothetical protein